MEQWTYKSSVNCFYESYKGNKWGTSCGKRDQSVSEIEAKCAHFDNSNQL